VWLKIAIVPKRTSSADAQTFSIGLEKGVGGRPWRVDYWSPAGVGVRNPGKPPAIVSETKASLAKGWIFLPIGLFLAALLSIPVGLAVRGWIRTSRANRSYRLTL
jgi:hypothetical protein